METHEGHDFINHIQSDQELIAEFTNNMQLITKQTGVRLIIDTSREGIARMIPGDTRIFFNPIHTLRIIQAIQQKRAEEFGIFENFTFGINHLSEIVLHEINHMINHAELKISDKKIKVEGKKMNMPEYENFLHQKYGMDFLSFENMLEDIDVNNHATVIQAPVFESAKQDIYHHIAIPSNDFSEYTLADQFGRAILRESMLPGEKCVVDPRVRVCIDYLSEPGEALEKLRNPNLKYDEQLPIIHRLYEEYYLKFKEEDEKNQQENPQGNPQENSQQQQHGEGNEGQQNGRQGNNNDEAQNSENQGDEDSQQNGQQQNHQQKGEEKNQNNQQKSQSNNGESGENLENENGNAENGNTFKKSGIFGRLKDRLRKALGVEKDGENTDKNDNNESNNGENQNNNDNEEKNGQSNDSKKGEAQNDEKNKGDTDGNEKERPQRQPYIPGKPMLLPHIFENLDDNGNNILEQIEQSLNNKGKPNNEKSDNKESESDHSKEHNSPSSQDVCNAIQQAIQQALEQQEEDANKSPEERNLEAVIQKEWNIDGDNKAKMIDIKNAIKRQTQLKEQIKKLKDSKGQSVYDKITKEIFSKIVQFRRWGKLSERHARPFSEGGQLDSQNLVSGIIDWKAGNDNPRILKQEFREQKEKMKAGGFSITFILDGSSSMYGEKNRQQALSTLLMLYSLQQLNQDIKLEGGDMEDFLISTQVMMFIGGGQVIPIKDRGKELNMKDMIEVTNALGHCDGGTNPGDAVNMYYRQISKPFNGMSQKQYDEWREKVKNGKIKEILFVLSDGEFGDNPTRTIQKLREMGIIVCGIGITNGGRPILNYFGQKSNNKEKDKQGFGIVCENASNLGNTLNELLVQHLEDPCIIG